jgi:hypothetical protein
MAGDFAASVIYTVNNERVSNSKQNKRKHNNTIQYIPNQLMKCCCLIWFLLITLPSSGAFASLKRHLMVELAWTIVHFESYFLAVRAAFWI